MSQTIEEVVGGDTMTVDIVGEASAVGLTVDVASNVEVPSEPPEDSGVVPDIDDGRRKKRKRKSKPIEQVQIVKNSIEDDSKRQEGSLNMPSSLSGMPFLPMKFPPGLTSQGTMSAPSADDSPGVTTTAKSDDSKKTPMNSSFPYYGAYPGPMAFIPVPLFPNFQLDKDGKQPQLPQWPGGFNSQQLALWQMSMQKHFMAMKKKEQQSSTEDSDTSGQEKRDKVDKSSSEALSPKVEPSSGGEDDDDKPIRTSVIMAGSHNKKQKRIRQEDKIGVDDMDQTLTVDPSTVEEDESVENKKEQTGDPPSPTSSDNSTSTNQSGPHDVLLRVSEAHLALLGDEDGDTPLHLAIIHERVDLVKEMLRTITNVNMPLDCANRMRQTPLHLAVITQQPKMVELLVNAGASVNFPDRKGNTSIHLAVQRRDMKCLNVLSKATSPIPDFNAQNFQGLAPVHLATQEKSLDVLKFLFQMGANKNSQDATCGRTMLHYAVEMENVKLVNFLTQEGCDTNAITYSGNTPLHIAAGRKMKDIVALLMAYGANPSIANSEGDIPHDLPPAILYSKAKRV